ncbi:cytochrome P450 CYP72A219-like [Rutidosis leptorrhynchoides]|uniref:cytochrome P450 CYP72A219-like n=1 Tax=Rutidosis leptorrhynchoides TaxID=125765 RepID=UPI003A998902
MELSKSICIIGVTAILVIYAGRILNWLWFKPKKTQKYLEEQGLKGTSYKFLFGDLKELSEMMKEAKSKPMSLCHDIAPSVSPFFHKIISTQGKNCFTWIGTKPMVHVSEPTMIREVLNNYQQFQKVRGGNPLSKFLVKGLFDVETDQWVKHRKIINPAFHMEKLKHMLPAFDVSCSEMINNWEKLMPTKDSCEVDVWPYLQKFSADVISRTAFGSSFEEGRKIFELQREQSELVLNIVNSIYIPGSRFLPTKINRRVKEIHRKVRSLITNIINKRVAAMKAGETSNDDLLDILLDSNNKEIKQHGNKKFGLSIDEVIEECKLFYFAGQETTANLLVWTMILLGLNTEWQTQAREEVLRLFGDKKPNIDGLSHLKVMNMIFNEVLRLYPPIVSQRRMVHKETKFGNLTIPAGTLIQVNTMILHHDKETWGEDVNEFKPERFSEGVSKVTKGATYLPFGGGPRICIGQNFAMLEAKLALSMILQRFSFELSPSYSHAPQTIPTLQPLYGAHLILHKL